MSTRVSLVTVEKDGDLRTHLAVKGVVTWTGGRESIEMLPKCGTRVDATALQTYSGDPVEVTCGRCKRTVMYANAVSAAESGPDPAPSPAG